MSVLTPLSQSRLPAVHHNGVWFVLGYIPSTQDKLAAFSPWGDANRVLPESEWREIDLDIYDLPVRNQGTTSSCVGQGSTTGFELCIRQSGRPQQHLSPYFTYAQINGGRDQGAMISDSLTSLMKTGACPAELAPRGAMYKQQFPASCTEAAKAWRLEKAFRCMSFKEICSAITLGFSVPLGIMVGQNFGQLDSEGVCPLPGGGGGGHCILGVGLKKLRRGWVIKIHNSWGTSWGQNGRALITQNHFQYMQCDAFAIQSVSDDPGDKTPEDEVPVVLAAAA